MRFIRRVLHPLLCPWYDLLFVRNIYGDEILRTGARSWWKCNRCGALIPKRELYKGLTGERQL